VCDWVCLRACDFAAVCACVRACGRVEKVGVRVGEGAQVCSAQCVIPEFYSPLCPFFAPKNLSTYDTLGFEKAGPPLLGGGVLE